MQYQNLTDIITNRLKCAIFFLRQANSNFLLFQERHGKFIQSLAIKNGTLSYLLYRTTLFDIYHQRHGCHQITSVV